MFPDPRIFDHRVTLIARRSTPGREAPTLLASKFGRPAIEIDLRFVLVPHRGMHEILPGVFTWHWFSERHGYDFNGYLLRTPDGNVCVDPVEMPDPTLDAIALEGVSSIVLTNRNHSRSSARLRERTGARVCIHGADAVHARAQGAVIDRELSFGDLVGPLVALDAHGKSPGEAALHWPERRILVVGDACVGNPPGACSLLPAKVIDDPAALRSSLRRLAAIDFDALLLGDGLALTTGGRSALLALVATFEEE